MKKPIPTSGLQADGQYVGRDSLKPFSVKLGHIFLESDPAKDTDAVRLGYLNKAMPQGLVSFWPYARETIPAGYGLCDGLWYDPNNDTVGQVGQASEDENHTVQTPVVGVHGTAYAVIRLW